MENITQYSYIFNRQQEILEDFLNCNTLCVDIGGNPKRLPENPFSKIEYLIKVLPGIEYIKKLYSLYVFSNDLTTGKVDDDQRLNGFLFRRNKKDLTNKETLKTAVDTALLWGRCGIRKYKDDIYDVPPGKYGKIIYRESGIETVVAYFVKENGLYLDKDVVKLNDMLISGYEESILEDFPKKFKEMGLILLDRSEFIEIKNPDTKGESPLLFDELRLRLLVTVYEQLNHDLNFNGPGRMIVSPEAGFYSSESGNEVSTGEVLSQSMPNVKSRNERGKAMAVQMMTDLKESKPDSILYMPRELASHIEQLPKQTKSTEFLEWAQNAGEFLAQVMGFPPSLLELGHLSGNVSMEKIIDNAMLNIIIPVREEYATQFSPLISEIVDVEKVYFDKYEMEQTEDEGNMLAKRADSLVKISSIDNKLTEDVVTDMLLQIYNNLHYDNGDLKELKLGRKGESTNGYEPNHRTKQES